MSRPRNNKPRRFKPPIGFRGIQHTSLLLARLAAMSTKDNHRKFTAELEEARKRGHGRKYRNLGADHETPSAQRFYAIAARSSYENRRRR